MPPGAATADSMPVGQARTRFDHTVQAPLRAMHDQNVLQHRCILDTRKVETSVAHGDEVSGEAFQ